MPDIHPRARRDGPVVLSAEDEDGERIIVGGTDLLRTAKAKDDKDVLVAHLEIPAERAIEMYDEIVVMVAASLFAPTDGDTQRGLS